MQREKMKEERAMKDGEKVRAKEERKAAMSDSGSRAWEEGEFSLQQSHDAVSQRMAAQCTETHTVQPQYIIFYGTYAMSMSPTHGASKASKDIYLYCTSND